MTKVKVTTDCNLVSSVTIEGHSGYAERGSDIICSAISGAVEVTMRILEKDSNVTFDIDETKAMIKIIVKQPNKYTNDCLNSLIGFLEDLSNEYRKFLKIYK